MNKVIIMGNLTRDPELRKTQNDVSVCPFTLAVNRHYGQNQETDFIDCVAWNAKAEIVSRYFHKGDKMLLEGRLSFRDWTDKDGNKRRTAEVISENIHFTSGKKKDSASTSEAFPEIDDESDLPY